ncbi:four-carbon acid sugar kinase family protein [Aminobacter anthyllidis]|uniref:four-carbon acid sugar kinase family protein n=1 Tax=Aminobacter anthyllidis TaxID=1035067 RepID=UPI0024575FB1|nr:four-carbon acid sugar kinase family protein [Aminobacter anthyllidis]MDH4987385.1 four-carbon acid sugar kinase family protein [Aminobacter anthyllidis]
MTLMLAIVADDLTGALDTSAPFVASGLKVAVAMTVEAMGKALASAPDVFAVSTASRALPADVAAAKVRDVAKRLMPHAPGIVMKKIDSRLKGNVGVEADALAEASGRDALVVAPAVPDQGRTTRDGAVVGRGVDAPLPVLPAFAGSTRCVSVRNAANDADLDQIVADTDWSKSVAVGARGVGLAFARNLHANGNSRHAALPANDQNVLFAFGSRDPITDQQLARLVADNPDVQIVGALNGRFALPADITLPAVVRCTGDIVEEPARIAARFAEEIAEAVHLMRPSTLVMGGGDTALAILGALGADVLFPRGEVAPGLPWFTIATRHGEALRCVVKSGGFGTVAVLSDLLRPPSGEQAERT